MDPQQHLIKAVQTAAKSGTLKLDGWDLTEIPNAVFQTADATPAKGGVEFGSAAGWWEVYQLTKLVLSHNRISIVPDQIASLESLTLLDLSHNQLTELPDALHALSELKSMDVSSNPLTSLPPVMGELQALVQLKCANCKLQEVPDSLGFCEALVELSLAGNQLATLPERLAFCTALTTLDVQGNQLTRLPAGLLRGATSLTELNASRNKIQGSLNPEIASLSNLVRLDLRQNQLSSFPDGLQATACALRCIGRFRQGGSRGAVFPRASRGPDCALPVVTVKWSPIAGCRALAELYLGYNHFTKVPVQLSQLPCLSTLDLR
ncbi:hypothetical protein CYMTET_33278 [Cymbomonas tetramitiformis]|uniref:Uncharacterized protein n=1 Tax=Cymbomonas tetramitiformis TaxID=36881 RepID=A0AAE0FE23_9CHLO|nr:hypothetical protein CYMTET_33278 [Cymbomonas tetramitiformis]